MPRENVHGPGTAPVAAPERVSPGGPELVAQWNKLRRTDGRRPRSGAKKEHIPPEKSWRYAFGALTKSVRLW